MTGGAGFIGSNYLQKVVAKHSKVHYVNLDALTYAGNLQNLESIQQSPNYSFVKGSRLDGKLVDSLFTQYEFDAVVHFAAESHVDRSILDPSAFIRTNVEGTMVLLRASVKHWPENSGDHLFHHVSTDEVFGSLGSEGIFTPESPYAPRSPYAASKASADHLVRAFGETYGLPYVITNTSNNYGPFQFPEKLIPLTISNALSNKDIPIYGSGENIRDWLHVHDHCDALDLVLHGGQLGHTYLIGGSQEVRNIDLVHSILNHYDAVTGNQAGTSNELIRFVKDRAGHDFRYAIDSSKIEMEFGWNPQYDIESGLKQTISWYLDNQQWIDSVKSEAYRTFYDVQYAQR